MALVEGKDYLEHLYYDLANQIWYEPLEDGTIRVGFTPAAMDLAGEILIFTPKRIGHVFEAHRSFAIIEGGKWVGAAHAAFVGKVVAANAGLERPPAAAQRGPLRSRLDADHRARGCRLARPPTHRARDRGGVHKVVRRGRPQRPAGLSTTDIGLAVR